MENAEFEKRMVGRVCRLEVPKSFVRELRGNACYVLAVLCQLQLKEAGYGKFFYLTLQELLPYFPWLGITGLHRIIQKLESKLYIEIERRPSYDKPGRCLGYHVPVHVMDQWHDLNNRARFKLTDAIRAKRVSDALILNALFEQNEECHRTGVKSKLSRNAISRATGVALATVSDFIKMLKIKPEIYLQSVEEDLQAAALDQCAEEGSLDGELASFTGSAPAQVAEKDEFAGTRIHASGGRVLIVQEDGSWKPEETETALLS